MVFPQGYRNDQHGKLLLMAPSKDRAATLGFRCVEDAGSEFVVLVARGVYKFDVDEVPVPQGEASDLEPWVAPQ